ncbi:uncharacterized protein LOC142334653 [Convolutriloba macropyga]|uniref:uncharacterized protein LOC142334653 n=1 Tax=Convolutriloba macropyga TaxID=536237 RepID=UPI003F51B8FF
MAGLNSFRLSLLPVAMTTPCLILLSLSFPSVLAETTDPPEWAWWDDWFDNLNYQDWHTWNNNWDSVLDSIDDSEERDLTEKWHEVCTPYLQLCQHDTDCASDDVCVNYECIPMYDYNHYYNSWCGSDDDCGYSGLVCCDQDAYRGGHCCHRSVRNHFETLPCRDNNDCCEHNQIDYCCNWQTGGSMHGTCCTFEQYNKNGNEFNCGHDTCGLRMECCPGKGVGDDFPDYCCPASEYRLLMKGGKDCEFDHECFSGYCCERGKCCTHNEHMSENTECTWDSDCYYTHECIYDQETQTNRCQYRESKDEDDDDTGIIILMALGCLILLGVCIVIVVVVVISMSAKNNGKKSANMAGRATKKQQRNRVSPDSINDNNNFQQQYGGQYPAPYYSGAGQIQYGMGGVYPAPNTLPPLQPAQHPYPEPPPPQPQPAPIGFTDPSQQQGKQLLPVPGPVAGATTAPESDPSSATNARPYGLSGQGQANFGFLSAADLGNSLHLMRPPPPDQ